MSRSSVARSLHDLGLAAWFGGSLMGAVGVNGAVSEAHDPKERARLASSAWARWAPLNAAAIGVHLLGGALIVKENRHRLAGQQGVAAWSTAKLALTGCAVAATALSGALGTKVASAGEVDAEGATSPSTQTPGDVSAAQRKLAVLQWTIPALTGGIVVSNAVMGEQQRPREVLKGTLKRAKQAAAAAASTAGSVAAHPSTAKAAVGLLH